MPLQPTLVTTLDGEQTTWNISRNLGSLTRPVNGQNEDKESLRLLIDDENLKGSLMNMMCCQIAENASIARKDGLFGVLFEHSFDCDQSDLVSAVPTADRGRVMRRIQADLLSELKLNPRLPSPIQFCLPDPQYVAHKKVGLWAFVPLSVMEDSDWDYDILDDVVALLIE